MGRSGGRLIGAAVAVLLMLVGLPSGMAEAAGVYDAIPQSDLRNLVTAMDTYAGFDSPDGTYRGVTAEALAAEGWVRSSTDAVTIEVLADGQDFGAVAQDVRGSSEFAFQRYGPGSYHGVGAGAVGVSSPQPAQPATVAQLRIVDGNTVLFDGPLLAGETAGGSNPAEACSSRCHGDPVNAITGEFFDNKVDLAVAGVGPGVSFSRSYGASVAGRNGPLGFGWRSSYGLSLEVAPGATGTGLSGASEVLVRQENSSVVSFKRAADGTLGAAPRVLATVTGQADGTFTFLRRPDQLFTFSATGVLQKVADLNGNTTVLTYTVGGLLDRATAAAGAFVQLGYDAVGRVSQLADQTGRKVSYGYNPAGELSSVSDVTGAVTTMAYGPGHLLASITGPRGAVTANTYDGQARVTSQRDPLGRITTWAYTTGTSGGVVTGTTTITSVTDTAARTATFGWDAGGNLALVSYPNGVTTTNGYTAADQLATSSTAKGATSLLALGYTYSPSGLTTQATATGSATANAPPQTYTYDPLRRLAQVSGPTAGPVGFDTADNLSVKPGTGSAGYDSAGQLLRRTASGGATTDYSYDGRGNRTAATPTATPAQITTYSYDPADRLSQLTAPAGTSGYRYDGDGLLATTHRTVGATTSDATVTWDSGSLGGLPLLLSDGTRNYLYGPDNQPYAQISRATGGVLYLHHDQIGSTQALTDSSGTVTGASSYDAYGTRTKIGSGGSTNAFGYAGEYTDAAGLSYLRARHYDPVTGTFLTRDPLTAQTGTPYSYGGGNPASNTDPSGLCLGLGNGCPGSDLLYSALQTGAGRAATSTLVGIGDGASFSVTASRREAISPGSSCTFGHNAFYYTGAVGGFVAATNLTLGFGATRVVSAAEETAAGTRSVDEVLNGLPRGKQGFVRTVPDEATLQSTFEELTQGGTPTTWKGYGGDVFELPDGTQIGLRGTSRSGGSTIDLRIPGQDPFRIHIG